jgi:hypothetical protein
VTPLKIATTGVVDLMSSSEGKLFQTTVKLMLEEDRLPGTGDFDHRLPETPDFDHRLPQTCRF